MLARESLILAAYTNFEEKVSVWLSLLLARESRHKPVGYFFDDGIRCWKPQQCGQRTCLVLRWSQKHKLRRRFVKTSVLLGFTS